MGTGGGEFVCVEVKAAWNDKNQILFTLFSLDSSFISFVSLHNGGKHDPFPPPKRIKIQLQRNSTMVSHLVIDKTLS